MSFDILVFDPAHAPSDPAQIPGWEPDGGGGEPTPAIAAWLTDMRTRFAGYEDAPDELPEGGRFADYYVSGPSVQLSCAYGVAAELEGAVLETAAAHGVGFWLMSAAADRIWMPPARPLDTSARAGFTLTVDGRGEFADPSEAFVTAAAQWLDTRFGPGFLVLARADGDYVQAAGGATACTVEWRRWGERSSFRHLVAATSADESGELMSLPGHGREHSVLPNERLVSRDAGIVLRDFVRGDDPTPRYAWHDITAALQKQS